MFFCLRNSWQTFTARKPEVYNMSKIRSKGTKPELIVRKFLFRNGFRYKLHDKMLPGIVMKAVNILHKKTGRDKLFGCL
uniref:Uncharacterized protein n=2 Tax=Kuenenia stuttgartiensis TaxID=174633 RepID=Q1PVK2_KUEST|nr:hypothetical protein kustc0510 [Candidatus Kuenenia stuttgartiensis]